MFDLVVVFCSQLNYLRKTKTLDLPYLLLNVLCCDGISLMHGSFVMVCISGDLCDGLTSVSQQVALNTFEVSIAEIMYVQLVITQTIVVTLFTERSAAMLLVLTD